MGAGRMPAAAEPGSRMPELKPRRPRFGRAAPIFEFNEKVIFSMTDDDAPANPFAAPAAPARESGANYETILKIPVTVQVVLGSTSMPVASLMKLGRGAVISLDQRVGEPVNVVVNGRVVARGEVVVVDEDSSRFGVSLTEIVTSSSAENPN
jgi:flagellar motor switch protein FliN